MDSPLIDNSGQTARLIDYLQERAAERYDRPQPYMTQSLSCFKYRQLNHNQAEAVAVELGKSSHEYSSMIKVKGQSYKQVGFLQTDESDRDKTVLKRKMLYEMHTKLELHDMQDHDCTAFG